MTRGRIKLKYKGRSDIQLTGNPKICFWKYVYKQHTNFAKQSNQIDYEDTSYMENDRCSLFKFRILRNLVLKDPCFKLLINPHTKPPRRILAMLFSK